MSLSFIELENTTSQLWDFGWFDLTRFKLAGLLPNYSLLSPPSPKSETYRSYS